MITLQGAIEERPIFLSQYGKMMMSYEMIALKRGKKCHKNWKVPPKKFNYIISRFLLKTCQYKISSFNRKNKYI